jgi:hypothetical protein
MPHTRQAGESASLTAGIVAFFGGRYFRFPDRQVLVTPHTRQAGKKSAFSTGWKFSHLERQIIPQTKQIIPHPGQAGNFCILDRLVITHHRRQVEPHLRQADNAEVGNFVSHTPGNSASWTGR